MEVKYRNTKDESLDCLLHCVTTTSNFINGVKRKIRNISIVLVIVFMFVLDKALTSQTNVLWWIITAILGLFILVFIFGYKKYYINKCKNKMAKNSVDTANTPEGERKVIINNDSISFGTVDHLRKYKLIDVKETFDYDNHFCIVMKNGSVVCIPDKNVINIKKQLNQALDKRFDLVDDSVVYDTPF